MTNKELSREIVTKLKEAGIARKDFSIRVRDTGYDTAVNIRLKNAAVRISEVTAITVQYKSVRYDEYSGEILAGCNTYVFVDYDSDALNRAARPYLSRAEEILSNIETHDEIEIARNAEKHATLYCFYDRHEKALFESLNEGESDYAYCPTCWIWSARDLALALFRFETIGTIYA